MKKLKFDQWKNEHKYLRAGAILSIRDYRWGNPTTRRIFVEFDAIHSSYIHTVHIGAVLGFSRLKRYTRYDKKMCESYPNLSSLRYLKQLSDREHGVYDYRITL